MKCRDCEFYGIRAGETEPHCLVNDRMTDDFDLPCVRTQLEVCSVLTWHDCDNQLPVNEDKVLCVTRTKSGVLNIVTGYYAEGRWCCGMNSNVIFWASLLPVYGTLFREIRNREAER